MDPKATWKETLRYIAENDLADALHGIDALHGWYQRGGPQAVGVPGPHATETLRDWLKQLQAAREILC